ncbi:hypothetical protein GOP47_0024823 [Adiantum capillus-veneris]|uniref:DNA topoisomerase n=1 Tax=Adiantum capillus-veneris TaxID=13818 RepID=A0A9D4U2U1_ADICA|nr:hypothetical protein GOP47_0024823 [Adiantum capillus-veneris]
MKMLPQSAATARLRAFSVSLHGNSFTGTSPPLHTHTIASCTWKASYRTIAHKAALGMHATHHGLDKQHGVWTWRVFSSMSDVGGSNVVIHGEQCLREDLTTASRGPSKPKKCVVVVESPTKAKTVEKYLGPDYVVLPTYGHVRDLAAKAGSVRPDEDYAMLWEVPEAARTHINRIKQAVKGAECLILASDPDREGEAIAWHVAELLKTDGVLKHWNTKVVRVTFHEITKGSVIRAMQDPRDICSTLVTAYLARRALDHLIGFALSPVLWRKLPGSRSAGRVQSVALKLVCEREREIEDFVPQESWTVEAYASLEQESEEHSLFPIRPTHVDGRKIEKFSFGSDDAKSLSRRLMNQPLKVSSVQRHSKRRNPPQPYITSTLQMAAQAKLGYGAMRTMNVAQKLYEGVKLENEQLTGLITYMRTDGLQLSSEAVKDIRALVAQRYGDKYVPTEYRKFNSKVKNAQEAHEAIRPTDVYRLPSQLVHVLEKDALLLYTLIWKRTVACQMEQAVYEEAVVNFVTEDGSICLQGGSRVLLFPGFLAAMEDNHGLQATADVVEGESDHEEIDVGKHTMLFSLKKDDDLVVQKAEARQHFTRPPARLSEGLLVKAMEELGIGRPSTYATMLKTLESRGYVEIEHHRIIPKARGQMVATFLSHYFAKYIDYDFTAHLEEQLDEVSGGKVEWKEVLRGFWPEFESVVATSLKVQVSEVIDMLQQTLSSYCFKGLGISGQTCPSCGQGKLTLKLSRFGSGYFFGCNRYPDCSYKAQLLDNENVNEEEENKMPSKMIQNSDVLLGLDPDTNLEVRVRKGPYGYYIQSGKQGKGTRNFKIPEGINPSDLTLEKAKELMKFPMSLGKHPEDGELVTLGIGSKAYYVRHRNVLASIPKGEAPQEVTLERAVNLLKGKKVRRIGRKGLAVHAAEEKKRILQQQKASRKDAVSRGRKVVQLSIMTAEGDDPKAEKVPKLGNTEDVEGAGKAKRIRKPRPVKTDGEEDDPNSSENVEGEPIVEMNRKRSVLKIEGKEGDHKVKEVRKVSSMEVVDDEAQAKMIGKEETVEAEGESTAGNVATPSPDNLAEGELKAKRLLHRKCNESLAGDEKVKKSTVSAIREVNFEADATVQSDAGKRKSRKKKAQLVGEGIEDGLDPIQKIVVNIEGEAMSQTTMEQGSDCVEEGKPKAKRLARRRENDSIAAKEKEKITGAKEAPSKADGNGKQKRGRNTAVDDNVQMNLEAKEPGLELSSNGRLKRSTGRKSTKAAV